jgi:RNA polymerase sigma-70 factor (ECF subfamily)
VTDAGQAAFRGAFDAHFRPVLGFAMRRCASASDAADVASETFLVAWRRRDELPPEPETRLWLFGVARRVLANQQRGGVRRDRLGARFREHFAMVVSDQAEAVVVDVALRQAMAKLGPADREVITLSVWEELEPREIAVLLGVSSEVVRTRLRRARARLRDLLVDPPEPPPGRCHDNAAAGHLSAGERLLAREEEPR